MSDESLLSFQPLRLKRYATIQDHETSEAKHWRAFKLTAENRFPGSPNCIHFNPSDQISYIVTGSTRVSLFGRNDKIQRSYSRFDDEAYSGRFRKDGTLLIAGDKSGYVRVFDVKTKAVLRYMKRHSAAVRAAVWGTNALQFITGSDDYHVKLWDLPGEDVLWSTSSATAHADYVRCVAASPAAAELFISGSYDHFAHMWDSRMQSPVHRLQHDAPVEAVLASPSGTLLFAAAGNQIKVWDLVAGGRVLHTFSSHQKNVTSLSLDSSASRLLSSGLDGHIKIHSIKQLAVVHGIKVGAPITSVALSPDDSKLVIGLVDGTLITRTKSSIANQPNEDEDTADTDVTLGKRKSRTYKGAGSAVLQTEVDLVEAERQVRLKPYEKHLKTFNYQKALDAVLKTMNPVLVITLLEELLRRSGLTIALLGRDEESLEPLLSFTSRYRMSTSHNAIYSYINHPMKFKQIRFASPLFCFGHTSCTPNSRYLRSGCREL